MKYGHAVMLFKVFALSFLLIDLVVGLDHKHLQFIMWLTS